MATLIHSVGAYEWFNSMIYFVIGEELSFPGVHWTTALVPRIDVIPMANGGSGGPGKI